MPKKTIIVAENDIKAGVYPETELLKSTAIHGCSLLTYYQKKDKGGSLMHFYGSGKLILPDGVATKDLDSWILAMLKQGKERLKNVGVSGLRDLDVMLMIKTLNREMYTKRENETLEKLCKILSPYIVGLDKRSYGGIYLKDGAPFVE